MAEMRRCRGCDTPLMFVKGENGKLVPLDLKAPVYEITKDLAGQEVAKRVGDKILVNHYSTCPKWKDFKEKRP